MDSNHPRPFPFFSQRADLNLKLDPQIRDWVLIPILVIMILFGFLREYLSRYMRSDSPAKLEATRHRHLVMRSIRLRSGCAWISQESARVRQNYFCHETEGEFSADKIKELPTGMQAMGDPSQMMNQQKMMMTGMVPQMVMMGIITYFFSGFVVAKITFPLALRFQAMTQRGVELSSLDVTYVASFSWWILVSSGLQGIMTLLMGQLQGPSDVDNMQMQMTMGMNAQGPQDMSKVFENEKASLKLLHVTSLRHQAQARLLSHK